MFGIKFIKVQPTTYLLQYRGGKIVREGLGLSFFYYAPTTSLVAVPVASADVPFIFQETTADFQGVTITALSPGWLLYPAGTTGDALDWSSGVTSQSWINVLLANGNTNARARASA